MKFSLKNKQLILSILLMSVFLLKGKAQTGMAFYPIENQFNSSRFNPAFLTSAGQFTFSVSPLAGSNVGYNNQKEIQSLVTKLLSGINKDAEYIDLVKSMVDKPTYNQKLETDLLSFTFKSKDGFFNFRVAENASFSASVQGPVSLFTIKPEVKSLVVGEVQNVPALIVHYREYSIAYSTPANHRKISAGIRAKLYFGKAAFSSDISGSVEDVAGNYYLRMKGLGKMSVPEESSFNPDGSIVTTPSLSNTSMQKYLMNSGNPGFGVDLGIKYKITPKFSFSMSIIDLGKITWKNNLNSKNFSGEYLFKGSSILPGTENGVDKIYKTSDSISFTDNVSSLFKVQPNSSRFSTRLPTTFYAGLNYQLNPVIKINLTERFIQLKTMNHNSFSLTANFELNKKFTVNTGFSAIGNLYNNMPLAILYSPDFGQVYLGTDNFLSYLTPSISEYSSLTFGMCFYLFRKRNLYDSPTDAYPFHKPKKVKKVKNSGRIMQEYDELYYPQP